MKFESKHRFNCSPLSIDPWISLTTPSFTLLNPSTILGFFAFSPGKDNSGLLFSTPFPVFHPSFALALAIASASGSLQHALLHLEVLFCPLPATPPALPYCFSSPCLNAPASERGYPVQRTRPEASPWRCYCLRLMSLATPCTQISLPSPMHHSLLLSSRSSLQPPPAHLRSGATPLAFSLDPRPGRPLATRKWAGLRSQTPCACSWSS
jgi:hypothetical protein